MAVWVRFLLLLRWAPALALDFSTDRFGFASLLDKWVASAMGSNAGQGEVGESGVDRRSERSEIAKSAGDRGRLVIAGRTSGTKGGRTSGTRVGDNGRTSGTGEGAKGSSHPSSSQFIHCKFSLSMACCSKGTMLSAVWKGTSKGEKSRPDRVC